MFCLNTFVLCMCANVYVYICVWMEMLKCMWYMCIYMYVCVCICKQTVHYVNIHAESLVQVYLWICKGTYSDVILWNEGKINKN